ncbi:PREDICTED: protein tyrosine phosphatase type IVA 3 [Condylura cristata]|uniref:protein tyrosine phosphatase type IVA 3 n=1 Tax=Condylura cristata TaxID=143302 RepID=UPI000643DF00|nr:PREDICTED: protein tyrosine phosphatase type IVA 3 [Condylura cristata]
MGAGSRAPQGRARAGGWGSRPRADLPRRETPAQPRQPQTAVEGPPAPAQPASPLRQDLKRHGATTVVRVCEVTYDKAPLEKDGITVVVGHPPAPRKRRGAINSKQLTYLEKYRPKQRLRFKEPHTHRAKCCVM